MSQMWFPAAPAQMLVDRLDVKQELKLTPDQVTSIATIAKANAKTFMEKFEENWLQISKVLTPAQIKRAEQLAFQGLGVASALVPRLRDEVGVTKEQIKKLSDIQHRFLLSEDKEMMEPRSIEASASPSQIRADRAMRQQMILDSISAVLTASQHATLKKLQGPSFKFTDPAPRPISTWMHAMGTNG